MKNISEMTPIELNVLINKINENHELVKEDIMNLLNDVDKLKKDINSKLTMMENLETKYVETMNVLIEKQKLIEK